MILTDEKIKSLESKAKEIRKAIVEMILEARSGHLAGALGMADIFTYLYFHAMRHDAKKPKWSYRDRLILSNGHICAVLYATLAHSGYIPIQGLKTFRKLHSPLQGHPWKEMLANIETSSGPLGSGLSQAIGMTIADRIDNGNTEKKFYCLMSDGEIDAGNTWEGAMLASKEKLHNLVCIIDRNKIQISGLTHDVMPLEPLADKWRAFGWHVSEMNGHDFKDIDMTMNEVLNNRDKPNIIIAHTIASKGIPEFENKYEWHGKVPTTEKEIKVAREAFA